MDEKKNNLKLKSFQLSPTPDKHHHYRVIIYGIGAIMFLLVGGGIGYLIAGNNNVTLTSTSNNQEHSLPINQISSVRSTSSNSNDGSWAHYVTNWQTYTNSTYNFSLDIPKGWFTHIYADSNNPGLQVLLISSTPLAVNYNDAIKDHQTDNFSFDIFPTTDVVAYDTYKSIYSSVNDPNSTVSREIFKAKIGNISGIATNQAGAYVIQVEHNGFIYSLHFHDSTIPSNQYTLTQFDNHVLSSFKFTN